MGKAKPLTGAQCQVIQEKMRKSLSLSEVTREAGCVRVVEYLLEDKPSLEQYLIAMAAAITGQRRQISHSTLILSIFHYEMSALSLYGQAFSDMLVRVVEREREIQRHIFMAENHLQIVIGSDVWKLYEPRGDILRLKRF